MSEKITYINLNNLITFEDHPFRVCNDEQMRMITESIRKVGILVPAIARPLGDGKYELISGHRRKKASEILGLETMPVIVRDVDHDIGTVMMVDSNLQREDILPSEKAKAYRMKLNAIKRQGARNDLTSDHYDKNKRKTSRDIIAESGPDSPAQVQRYLRLNELIDPLLQMVDEGKLGLTTGAEISFLEEEEQGWVYLTIQSEQSVPSFAQAVKMKKLFQSRKLTEDMILEVMTEQKKPECWNLTIPMNKVMKFFPKTYTPQLTKQNSGAQETISQLSSDNSKLKNELQKKSETVVSLNEQIGRMSEADLILKRNSELEMQNSEMNTFVRQIKKETDEKLEQGKAELEARRRELEEREAFVTKKEMKLDTCIQIASDRAVKFRIIDLEKEYDAKGERLSKGYKTLKGAYLGCMIISMAFALITALWNIGHNEEFLTDLTEAGRTIWLILSSIGKGVWWLAVHAALLSDKIGIGWLSVTVHWLLIILTIAVVVAGAGAAMYFPIRKYIRFFLKKQADPVTGFIAFFTVTTVIFMAEPLKAVVKINLVAVWVLLMVIYIVVRGVMQMEDREERRKVLIYAGAVIAVLCTIFLYYRVIYFSLY